MKHTSFKQKKNKMKLTKSSWLACGGKHQVEAECFHIQLKDLFLVDIVS